MKAIITILFALCFTVVYAQTESGEELRDSAEAMFLGADTLDQEALDSFDYSPIAAMLNEAISFNPADTEARYFLGYTYSRINAADGRGMNTRNLDLTRKASEQFEQVIKIEPNYTEYTITLDPYSKITSEWGTLAMSYLCGNKLDSAVWAFNEGNRRGGFSDFILSFNREMLDECGHGAILFTSGDNITIPLWYLQTIEKYRTDVAVVDLNLLNTTWYPRFLSRENTVIFDRSAAELDSLGYVADKDSVVTIGDFSWVAKPTYGSYYLRGDRVCLSLLKANMFRRDIYYSVGADAGCRLGLYDYMSPHVLVDSLSVSEIRRLQFEDHKKEISPLLQLSEQVNQNSYDQRVMFESCIRFNVLGKIRDRLDGGEVSDARELMALLDNFANEEKCPYLYGTEAAYIKLLRDLMNNYPETPTFEN